LHWAMINIHNKLKVLVVLKVKPFLVIYSALQGVAGVASNKIIYRTACAALV